MRKVRLMKERKKTSLARREELLGRLSERAEKCPGLYPVEKAEEFLRVAADHGGGTEEGICQILELMWRKPDEAFQWNAQSLIQRGKGFVSPQEEKEGDPKSGVSQG